MRRLDATRFGNVAVIAVAATVIVALGQPLPATPRASARAALPIQAVAESASTGFVAQRVPHVVDAVSLSNSGPMTPAMIEAAELLALSLNVASGRGRSFSIGLHSVRRGGSYVQQAGGPSGFWQYPMSVTALPIDAVGRVMGLTASSLMAQGFVIISATSAGIHGVIAGDSLDLVAADGGVQTFVVGAVLADTAVGGAEVVMTPEHADALGATVVTRVLLYGQFSRDQLEAELAGRGLVDGYGVRISRSWAPANPDSTLGLGSTKARLGAFDYRINGDGSLSLDADWVGANIVRVNYQNIGVRASCHRLIIDDLQAALTEVYLAGLSFAIDLSNTNTYGGCWNPRYSRGSGTIGSVSRHAWGQPIDMNTVSNAQGNTPRMDCRVVRIFRKHNFAWGGNFLTPDGMHFEWVGERRDTLAYPSKYCPNLPGGAIESVSQPGPVQGETMFAADAWSPVVEPHDG